MKLKAALILAILVSSVAALGLVCAGSTTGDGGYAPDTLIYDTDYYDGWLNYLDAGWTDTYPEGHIWNIKPGYTYADYYYNGVAFGYQEEGEDPVWGVSYYSAAELSVSGDAPAACFWFALYGPLGYFVGTVSFWTDLG